MTSDPRIEEICSFWFGTLDANGLAAPEIRQKWFKKDPDFDREIKERFEQAFYSARDGELDEWRQTPRGTLALIILVDQFSRNMFRSKASMYSGDEVALEAARSGLTRGLDSELACSERVFFRMPLMHSEAIEDQEACVKSFQDLAAEYEAAGKTELVEAVSENIKYAISHRDIVAAWGRFPHRNEILGRTNTTDEIEFLKSPGSSF